MSAGVHIAHATGPGSVRFLGRSLADALECGGWIVGLDVHVRAGGGGTCEIAVARERGGVCETAYVRVDAAGTVSDVDVWWVGEPPPARRHRATAALRSLLAAGELAAVAVTVGAVTFVGADGARAVLATADFETVGDRPAPGRGA
ncbi:MAG: hypothetical protein D6689_19940 [Deltaproteobacteria bacterium]|nr:MAG: hypothetical protein D6689_19940 [Deltaproteobacteria bacterium]